MANCGHCCCVHAVKAERPALRVKSSSGHSFCARDVKPDGCFPTQPLANLVAKYLGVGEAPLKESLMAMTSMTRGEAIRRPYSCEKVRTVRCWQGQETW